MNRRNTGRTPDRRLGCCRRSAAVALVAFVAGCTGEQPAGAFEALTYNVAGLPRGISRSKPDRYIPLISRLLNSYDLVLVQEDFAYHQDLVADIEHPHRSAPMRGGTLATDGLNRFARFRLGPLTRTRWCACHGTFTNGGDCLARKGYSVSTVELAAGIEVDVYNLHAEAGHREPDSRARSRGFAQLAHEIDRRPPRAIILGGDTNLRRSREADAVVLADLARKLGVREVAAELGCEDRIDRFFYRNGGGVTLEPLAWRVAEEFEDASGEQLSDHLAIHVTFAWRAAP